MPFLDKDDLQRKGAIVITKKGPSIVSKNNIEYLSPLTNTYLPFSLPEIINYWSDTTKYLF